MRDQYRIPYLDEIQRAQLGGLGSAGRFFPLDLTTPASTTEPGQGPASKPPLGKRRGGLASDAAAVAIGGAFTQGAALLSIMLLTRLIAKSELGGYQQLSLVFAVLSPLLLAGIPAALQYFVPRSGTREEQQRWVLDAFLVLTVLGAGFSLLLIGLREPLASLMNNPDLAGALALYSPFVFFSFIAAVATPALVSVRRATLSAAVSALGAVFLVAGVAAAALLHPHAEALAVGASAGSAGRCLVSVAAVLISIGIRWDSAHFLRRWRRLCAFGVPLALTGIAGQLAFMFDRLVVAASFSPATYAIYAVGSVELPIAALIQQSANSVLIPAIAARHATGDYVGIATLWREGIRKTSLVMMPLFAFFFVMADDVVHVLFGGGFQESVVIFQIYLFLVPLRVATYGLIPQAVGRPSINLYASIVHLASNVVLALALLGPLGLVGPAVATPIATAVVVGYYMVRIPPLLAMSLSDLLQWRLLFANLVLALASALPLLALLPVMDRGVGRLVAAAILFVPVYFLVFRASGRITDEDWSRLHATIRGTRSLWPIRRREKALKGE